MQDRSRSLQQTALKSGPQTIASESLSFLFAHLDQREGDHENVEMAVINAQDPEQGNLYYLFKISTRFQALLRYKIIYDRKTQLTARQFCNKFCSLLKTLKSNRKIKLRIKFFMCLRNFL